MLRYRAVRAAHQNLWTIQIFDTEAQVSYDFNTKSSTKRSFLSRREAESYIQMILDVADEVGEWFDGPV